jgi:hypothetical protein
MTRNQTLGFEEAGLALHITASARAAIVRATVFTRVSPQSCAKGSSSSFHLPGRGRSGGSILAGPRGRIARRQRQCQEKQSYAKYIPKKTDNPPFGLIGGAAFLS